MQHHSATTKTPFRMCLTGATDLLPYVKKFRGEAFGSTIDKFVTVTVARNGKNTIAISAPEGTETVSNAALLKNAIAREALAMHGITTGVDIISTSDIPPGSGLGSSGAFTVGLIHALRALNGERVTPKNLAEAAADLEINRLKAPIGKHDQYMAAFGGFLHLHFAPDGNVVAKRIALPAATIKNLEQHLTLVWSGMKRSASKILSVADEEMKSSDAMLARLTDFRRAGSALRAKIVSGDIAGFGAGVPALFAAKKACFANYSNTTLDALIARGISAGATGAKIIGAGGGGFLYFFVLPEKRAAFEREITAAGGTVYPFVFEPNGSALIART